MPAAARRTSGRVLAVALALLGTAVLATAFSPARTQASNGLPGPLTPAAAAAAAGPAAGRQAGPPCFATPVTWVRAAPRPRRCSSRCARPGGRRRCCAGRRARGCGRPGSRAADGDARRAPRRARPGPRGADRRLPPPRLRRVLRLPGPRARPRGAGRRGRGRRPHHLPGPGAPRGSPGRPAVGGLGPGGFASTYDIRPLWNRGDLGQGQTIVFFEVDGYSPRTWRPTRADSGCPPFPARCRASARTRGSSAKVTWTSRSRTRSRPPRSWST